MAPIAPRPHVATPSPRPQVKAPPPPKSQPQTHPGKAPPKPTSAKPASAKPTSAKPTSAKPQAHQNKPVAQGKGLVHKEVNKTVTHNKTGQTQKQVFKPHASKPTNTNNTKQSKLQKLVPSKDMKAWSAQTKNYSAQAFQKNGSFNTHGISGHGQVNVLQAHAQGNASASFDPKHGKVNLEAGVNAGANLVQASGHVQNKYGTSADVNASIGVNGSAKANATFDPRHGNVDVGAHANAFAGAEVGGTLSQKVGPATASATAHAKAGIGANFDATAGLHNGKLEAKFDIGATLGIGGDVGFDVTVDPKAALKDAGNVVHGVEHAASSAWHSIFG